MLRFGSDSYRPEQQTVESISFEGHFGSRLQLAASCWEWGVVDEAPLLR